MFVLGELHLPGEGLIDEGWVAAYFRHQVLIENVQSPTVAPLVGNRGDPRFPEGFNGRNQFLIGGRNLTLCSLKSLSL